MHCGFTIIEHPADVGIEAYGASVGEAFAQAAYGMMSIIAERGQLRAVEERTITLACDDYEQLLVRWLSEVLYMCDAEHFLPAGIVVVIDRPGALTATVSGERFDPSRHMLLSDIKAVTYHQVFVDAERAFVRVYLDV